MYEMKFCIECKVEVGAIHNQGFKAYTCKLGIASKEVKCLCKEIDFTAGMLKTDLTGVRLKVS